jgi:hypothetical protein
MFDHYLSGWWSSRFIQEIDRNDLSMTSQELSEKVAEEVRSALSVEDTRMGEVFRLLREGKTETEIAEIYGPHKGWVYSYRRIISLLESGSIPTAPTVKRHLTSTYRSFLNRHNSTLSPEVAKEMRSRLAVLETPSGEEPGDESAFLVIRRKQELVLRDAVAGIYVYTLPHYYRQPMQPSEDEVLADRTLMKVGKSDSDVIRRFTQQERNTALPEDPLLLRIYISVEGKGDVERRFHLLLSAADHRRNKSRVAGTEWFLTSLKFLDALAADMGLTQYFVLTEEEE